MKTYQFLWGKDVKRLDKNIARCIKAKSLQKACIKFYNNMPCALKWVDYEVKEGNIFHDISDNRILKEFNII